MTILDAQMKNAEQREKAEKAAPLIEQIIESSGALDCNGLVEFYTPKYNATPNDAELISKVLRMFKKQDCSNEFSIKLSEKLYQLAPSAEAAFNMARLFLKKEEFNKALSYYKEAYTSETNPQTKAKPMAQDI